MSEELQSLVQIMELYGRGMGGLGRAIRFSAKEAKKGVDYAKVKKIQHKMKLHCASTGKHKTMKLKDLELLTGNRYNILNIPLEEEKGLMDFYDRLKKMHVSFAELPDLQMGDGYTQIAYNPNDAENVRMVINYYRSKLAEEPRDINLEEYMRMAGKDGEELLNELAAKGYTENMHIEQLEEIQQKFKDGTTIPISLNFETLLIKENKDSYVMRIPRGRTGNVIEHAMIVKKSDALILDQGQENENFLAPDLSLQEQLSEGEKTMGKVLSFEELKERQSSSDYIPITFDMNTQVVAENQAVYATSLPESLNVEEEKIHCIILDKENTHVSEDGKRLTAYLKKTESSNVMEFDAMGEKLREFKMSNEEIARDCLKKRRSGVDSAKGRGRCN